MAEDKTRRAWSEVRNTLGRLFARAAVRELPPELCLISIKPRQVQVSEWETAQAGAQEEFWRPQPRIFCLAVPSAQEGGQGVDLSQLVSVISANHAVRETQATVQQPAWRLQQSGETVCHLSTSLLNPPEVYRASAQIRNTVRHYAGALLAAPSTHRLSVPAISTGTKNRSKDSRTFWQMRTPLVRSGIRPVADIPMTRVALSKSSSATDFSPERQLAASSGVPLHDIVMIGVFPRVPLSAVKRLSVLAGPAVSLQIWLKPEALGGRISSHRSATIILGRQRSTGKTLQTVVKLPES